MNTIRDRIVDYLRQHPEGVDDDDLARALELSRRQQANQYCRRLRDEGFVERRQVRGKIHNFLVGSVPPPKPQPQQEPDVDEPWFWEGHVQGMVVTHLATQGYIILRVADTAARETGKDIVAKDRSGLLWVTVKGYPKGTTRTRPSTQAGHWFKDALFDMIAWRGEDPDVELAIALPDFPRYRRLAEKVAWLQPVTPFFYIWVQKDGSVVMERGG